MARKRGGSRRKNWSKYLNGTLNIDVGAGTLANKTGVSGTTQSTVTDTTRVSSIKATYTLSDFTPGNNIGPILVAVAHPDYSDAEIEEFIESTTSWDVNDMIAAEQRGRRVRIIGVFNVPETSTHSSRLNDGKPVRTKLNWVLGEGDGLKFFVYNTGNASVATTIPNINIFGNANLWAQ